MTNHTTGRRGRSAASTPHRSRRRGRPTGTVCLTDERAHTILNYIRAGAYPHVAAEAGGISVRSFHDLIARGEGRHPTRPCTPKLRAFAQAVRTAQAEARLGAEVRVYREQPTYWLSRAARTTPEREGWTDPRRESETAEPMTMEKLSHVPDEVLNESIERIMGELFAMGGITVPPCSHPRCRCPHHRKVSKRRRRG